MTDVVYPPFTPRLARSATPPRAGMFADWIDEGPWEWVAAIMAMLCLLAYTQSWIAPLFGYRVTTADSAFIRNAYLPIYGLATVLMITSWKAVAKAFWLNLGLLAVMGIVFASTLWSIDPPTTLRRSVALVFTTFAGVVIAARWPPNRTVELIAAVFAFNAVLSFVMGAAFPELGRMQTLFPGAWRGLWLEKNNLAGLMSVGVMTMSAAAVLNPRRAWLWAGFAVLATVLVVLSQSKTGLMSVIFGLGMLGAVWGLRRNPAFALATLWAVLIAALAVGLALTVFREQVFGLLGKDATLTGRTELWAAAWKQFLAHRWIGYGYGVLWEHMDGWYPGAWIAKESKFVATHAHNAWLEAVLSFGLFGTVVWLAYYLQVIIRALSRIRAEAFCYFAVPFLSTLTMRSFTEVPVLRYHDIDWVMFVITAVSLSFWRQDDHDAKH